MALPAGAGGNYDSTGATDYKHCGCRSESPRQEALALSYAWTCTHVATTRRRLFAALPFRLVLKPPGGHLAGPTVALVHAMPTSSVVYVTEDRPDPFLTRMAQQAGLEAGDVLCFGHTHKLWSRVVERVTFVTCICRCTLHSLHRSQSSRRRSPSLRIRGRGR